MMDRDEDYYRLVMLCRDKKLDFKIYCGAKEHKQFILNLMDCPARIVINKVEYYLGKKYQTLMHDPKRKSGRANFNNRAIWRAINNMMNEFG